MGAFVSYSQREDMQDDTYKLVAGMIYEAIQAHQDKNLKLLERRLSGLYVLIHMRVKAPIREDLKRRRDEIRQQLYGSRPAVMARDVSRVLDMAEELLLLITDELDKANILYRARSDLNSLVAN